MHMRPYTDTRIILELLTQQHGRCAAVARLSKKNKAQFQPFIPSWVQFFGKSELKTLTDMETFAAERVVLEGKVSFCGLYLNELILRLLPQAEVCTEAFALYEFCLARLWTATTVSHAEQHLRRFEFELLQDLGYGLDFNCSVDGEPLLAQQRYRFEAERGFVRLPGSAAKSVGTSGEVFNGQDLICIGRGDYASEATTRAAKYLARKVISPLLGGRPLKSRELFS